MRRNDVNYQINQKLAKKALGYINDNEVVRFAQEFVRINSVNPNLEPGSTEQEAAEFLANACKEVGIQTALHEIAPGRPNFYAVLPGESEQIGLAFFGHIDTIALIGMENPFSGKIVDGHIWGRGSVDQKGGVAASVQALIALARSGIPLKKSVAVWGVADEESEHRGAYAIAKSGWTADFAISTEPSERNLLVGNMGTTPLRISLKGVSAHGSNPWLGINAIEKAAAVIQELNNIKTKKFTIPELDIEVQGTYSIGVIKGGDAYNIVADECSIFLDRRTVPGETRQGCLEEIQQLFDKLAAQDPDFKAEVEVSRPDWHWEPIKQRGLEPVYTPVTSPVAQAVQAAFRELYGEEMGVAFTHGYTDMDFFVNSMGIHTINYGPGDGNRYAHTVDEMLDINHLLEATRIYLLAALQIAA
jgi:acetylornithine deacetylase/succinyl-diaminopimelate desuccinylase